MEKAPFKLNQEYVDVLGGRNSALYSEFVDLVRDGFQAARKHASELITLLEIMNYRSNYPSFLYNSHAIADVKSRFFLDANDSDVPRLVTNLVNK